MIIEKLESICINGFDDLKLTADDFNDQFHLNEIGSKVSNYLNVKFQNVNFKISRFNINIKTIDIFNCIISSKN